MRRDERGDSLSDPTVLGMINDNLNDIKAEQKKVTSCMTSMKVNIATNTVKLEQLDDGQKELKKNFQHHINNKKKHYNQGYQDTMRNRLGRRKVEISIGTIIATVITLLANHFMGG